MDETTPDDATPDDAAPDDTSPVDTGPVRPSPPPSATDPADGATRRVAPGVAAGHGMWTGALLSVVVLAGLGIFSAGSGGVEERLVAAVALSAWLGVVWVPSTALWGGLAGLAGGVAARLTDSWWARGRDVAPIWMQARLVAAGPVLVAALGGAAAGWTVSSVVDVGLTPALGSMSGGSGALVGAAAVALERRGARRAARSGQPRHRGVLAAVTAVLVAVAWLWTGWVSLRAQPWDWGETCGHLLGRPSSEVGFASGRFPPQGWCLGGTSEVVPTQPVWHAVLAALLLTAAFVALVALLARSVGPWRSRTDRVVARVVLVVAVGGGLVWGWATATAVPPDEAWDDLAARRAAAAQDAVESAAAAAEAAAGVGTSADASAVPTPTAPQAAPPVSGAAARADLEVLRVAAQDAGGPDLLWPQPLGVVDVPCTTADGAAGVLPSLTGRFTTRDLATATDNLDFLSITQANEDVAARIVQAWSRDGLGTPEPLHGEWWQGPTPDGRTTVEIAHVGFEEGVGAVQVDAVCTTPP